MKKLNILPLLLIVFPLAFSSCDLIGGILEAGIWVGIIIVVVVVALILWILRKVF